jgi:inorganic triphosphatase YgiF
MADEIEIKLGVPPERAGEVRRLELLRQLAEKRGSTRQLSTVYFDTPDQALAKRGIALRIRSAGRRKLQTIKLPAEGPGGLQIQREVETPVAGDRPEFDRISDLRLRRLFTHGGIADGLAPLFLTEFKRSAWPLRFNGSLIELAFDQGEIRAGSAHLALSEIELELKEGRPEHIFELALAVHEALPITLGQATKAARGYALLDGAEPQPAKAMLTGLLPTMTARHAFAIAARNCLAQMRGNEASARLGQDPEGIHQLRVGLRRLRALVNAYRDALAPAAHEFLSRELRWLQQELNPARDWDVFIATTLEPITRRMPGLEACLAAAKELRDLAQGRATATLAAPRYTAFLLHCYHWLATGAWALADTGLHDRPVAEFAAAMLQRRHRRLLKFGGKRADLPEADLHRLRLMAKKQRYIGDFFREIYPRKATGRYITALADIQDVLGSLNDALVSRHLVEELERYLADAPPVGPTQAARAAGVILGWQGGRIAEDLNRVSAVWKEFTKHKIFWPRPEEPLE